jgi:hypothetical protein
VRELLHGLVDVGVGDDEVEVGALLEALDLRLEEMPRRQRVGKVRVVENGVAVELGVAADADLDVPGDRLDHTRQIEEARARLDLVLERADEELLPRDPVEVVVGVPVADEIERLVAAELLVAGEEVDRRVAEVAAAVVEVAAVDIDPDPSDRVDELPEPAEVDRDQVVDRRVRERTHGLERPFGAAGGVRLVDPRAEDALAGTVDLDEEVARERQHRDRLRLRVGPDEHDRVRARLDTLALTGALVVAHDERGRGLTGQGDVEPLRRDLHVGSRGDDVRNALVEPEVRPAGGRADDDEQRRGPPGEGGAHEGPARPRRRLGLTVDRDRRERAGRQDCASVAVGGRTAAHASLQRRPHNENAGRNPRGIRIAAV